MAITSLFGPTPQELIAAQMKEQEQMDLLRNQQIGQQGREFGVFAPLYQAGLKFGDLGSRAITQSLFPEVRNPQLQQAQTIQSVLQTYQGQNLGDPSVLQKIASDLFAAGAPDAGIKALATAKSLTTKDDFVTGKPGEMIFKKGPGGQLTEVVSIPDRDQMVKTPADFAAAGRELGFGVRPNIGEYSQAETKAINNLLEARGIKRAEAGVPRPGEVKITDIATAQSVVDRYVKDPKDKLTTVNNAKTQLALAFKGEGAALPQLQRQLVKLVGDSQIGQGEVRDALGSAGIVSDTISAVNKFMTGVPTQDKLKSVEQVINALEDINARSFNQGRKQAEQVVGEAKFSEQTRKTLIPPAYKTGREKTAESLKGQDKQAYDWAKANPTDSRSTAILNRLGVQ